MSPRLWARSVPRLQCRTGADMWVWGHGLQTLVLPPALMRAQGMALAVQDSGRWVGVVGSRIVVCSSPTVLTQLVTHPPTLPIVPRPLRLPLTRREGTTAVDWYPISNVRLTRVDGMNCGRELCPAQEISPPYLPSRPSHSLSPQRAWAR